MLYIGPDQIIPLSGFLGTIAGLAMMFWGKLVDGVRRLSRAVSSKEAREQ